MLWVTVINQSNWTLFHLSLISIFISGYGLIGGYKRSNWSSKPCSAHTEFVTIMFELDLPYIVALRYNIIYMDSIIEGYSYVQINFRFYGCDVLFPPSVFLRSSKIPPQCKKLSIKKKSAITTPFAPNINVTIIWLHHHRLLLKLRKTRLLFLLTLSLGKVRNPSPSSNSKQPHFKWRKSHKIQTNWHQFRICWTTIYACSLLGSTPVLLVLREAITLLAPAITFGPACQPVVSKWPFFISPCFPHIYITIPGLVDRKVTYEDDVHLPRSHGIGFTNLTAKVSRRASDLTTAEQLNNAPCLTAKIMEYHPKWVVFIGMGMYQIYSGQKRVNIGLQDITIPWKDNNGSSRVYVMPSTSGLVAAYHKKDKIK